jgi:uncharacterized lipoprotein YajG
MMITVEKNGNFTAPSLRLLLGVLVLVLAGCAASGDSAPQTPDQAAISEEQRAAKVTAVSRAAEERARLEVAQQAAREREAQARQAAEQQARVEEAARAEREQQARASEQQRLAAERSQREQQARIAELEAEIASARARTENVTAANGKLEEAIATAEELLKVLAAEQLKYSTTNSAGQLAEPLQKDLIADLESRKDSLKREAQPLVQK